MKKIILAIAISCMFGCANTYDSNTTLPYNNVLENLKPLSPECRKVSMVANGIRAASDAIKDNNHVIGAELLCLSYTYYKMSYMDINWLTESSEALFAEDLEQRAENCANFIDEKGDLAWWFFVTEADDTLKPYVNKHYDECFNQNDFENSITTTTNSK